jgi:hypothetical protein
MVQLIVPAGRHVKGRLSPSLLLLLYGCPSLQGKKIKKNEKTTVPKEHHSRSWTGVRDISISSLKMTTPLQSLAQLAASKGEDILLVLRHSMFCFFHLL